MKKHQGKIDMHYLKKMLFEMIKINSILGQESNLSHFLAEECKKIGMSVTLEEVNTKRENLYASYSFSSSETLTYNGHSDTVDFSEGWLTDPFTPIQKEGKIFGLGSVDMKAGLACQLTAIRALIESKKEVKGTIHFCVTVDEEGYGSGARKMLLNKSFGRGKTSGIVIAEPYDGASINNPLILGLSGKVLYKITVVGCSAHAFTPQLGINAISDAAKICNAIDDITQRPEEKKNNFTTQRDYDFGHGTFCTLKIIGGYKQYCVVIPENCEIILNRLTLPHETKESLYNDLKQLIDSLNLKSKVKIEIIPPFYQSYKIDKSNLLFRALETCYEEIYSQKPISGYLKMITDANIFAGEGGIPTVHFGPKGGNLHSANEYVLEDSLESTANMYFCLYQRFQKLIKK